MVGRYNPETGFIEINEYIDDVFRTNNCVVIDRSYSFNQSTPCCKVIGFQVWGLEKHDIVEIKLEGCDDYIPVICTVDDEKYKDIPLLGRTYHQDNLILPSEYIEIDDLESGSLYRIEKPYGEETLGIIWIDMKTRIVQVHLDGKNEPAYILDRWGV